MLTPIGPNFKKRNLLPNDITNQLIIVPPTLMTKIGPAISPPISPPIVSLTKQTIKAGIGPYKVRTTTTGILPIPNFIHGIGRGASPSKMNKVADKAPNNETRTKTFSEEVLPGQPIISLAFSDNSYNDPIR
jgi:hypothetical protein